mmetsp:Transcript_7002/g.15214  ORF Transcript_7002/g.15214 Transcript_7002/m.15214 type:complete len:245 (+) Transcript_7002:527-1261(+)
MMMAMTMNLLKVTTSWTCKDGTCATIAATRRARTMTQTWRRSTASTTRPQQCKPTPVGSGTTVDAASSADGEAVAAATIAHPTATILASRWRVSAPLILGLASRRSATTRGASRETSTTATPPSTRKRNWRRRWTTASAPAITSTSGRPTGSTPARTSATPWCSASRDGGRRIPSPCPRPRDQTRGHRRGRSSCRSTWTTSTTPTTSTTRGLKSRSSRSITSAQRRGGAGAGAAVPSGSTSSTS